MCVLLYQLPSKCLETRLTPDGGGWPIASEDFPAVTFHFTFLFQIFRSRQNPPHHLITTSNSSPSPINTSLSLHHPSLSTSPPIKPHRHPHQPCASSPVRLARSVDSRPAVPPEIRLSRFTTRFPAYTCRPSRNPLLTLLPCLTAADPAAVATASPMGTWFAFLPLDSTFATSPSKPIC